MKIHLYLFPEKVQRCSLGLLRTLGICLGLVHASYAQVTITNLGVEITNGRPGVGAPAPADIYIQGDYKDSTISANPAGNWVNRGNVFLSGNLINRTSGGIFAINQGKLILTGNVIQRFVGQAINFPKLTLDKPAGNLVLGQNVLLKDSLRLDRGNIDLNGFVLELAAPQPAADPPVAGGLLVGEANNKRVFGNAGLIRAHLSLNAPTFATNLAGLGLQIRSASNLGATVVERGHTRQTNAADGSILRYFRIIPTFPGTADSVRAHYFDANEIAGFGQEKDFKLWASTDNGTTYANQGGRVDAANNHVTAPSVALDNVLLTVSSSICANPPVVNLGKDTLYLCGGEGITLDAGNPGMSYKWSTGATTRTLAVTTPGLYYVDVTNARGCVTRASVRIISKPQPMANFRFDNVCVGQTVTFTNRSAIAADTMTFRWDFGVNGIASDTSRLANPSYRYPAAGSYLVRLTCTSTFGCVKDTTLTVTVFPLPVASFTVDNACLDSPVTFTNTSSIPGNTTLRYQWDFGVNGTVSDTSNVANPTYTYPGVGTYTVRLTVRSVQGGCVQSTTKNVTVYPKGTPDFTVGTACVGGATAFNNTSIVPNGDTPGYQWDFGDGATATSTNAAHTYASAGTYQVKLTYSTRFGCSTNVTKSVTVSALPTAPRFSNNGTLSTCGSSLVLDAGNPGSSYRWSDGNTARSRTITQNGTYSVTITSPAGCTLIESVSVRLNQTLKVDLGPDVVACQSYTLDAGVPGGTYRWSTGETTKQIAVTSSGTYSVQVTDPNGCESTDAIVVKVHPFSVSIGPDQTICEGSSITLDAGNPGSTYLWSDNSTGQTLTVNRSGVYRVTVTGTNGCVLSAEMRLTVESKPTVDLGPDQSLCSNSVLVLNAGNPGSTYQWTSSVGITASAQQLRVTSPGTYYVRVSNGTSCVAMDTVVVKATENSVTAQFLTASLVKVGDTLQFVQLSYPDVTTYQWNFGDGSVSSEANPTHIYLKDQDYRVSLVAGNGECSDTLTKNITVRPLREAPVPGPGSLFTEVLDLKVYPNPTSDRFRLELEINQEAGLEIYLYSLNGHLLDSRTARTDFYSEEFDLGRWPQGMYLLKVLVNGQLYVKKVIRY
jgi:PKD repeat protein